MSLKISVTYAQSKFDLDIQGGQVVEDLKKLLEELTGVIVRKQKLIFKGRVLESNLRLDDAKIKDGSKILLISSVGAETRGQQAARSVAEHKAAAAKARLDMQRKAKWAMGGGGSGPGASSAGATAPLEKQLAAWQKTKILPLRDKQLAELPSEVLSLGNDARVVDLCQNWLTALPDDITKLAMLHTVRLSHNHLTTKGLGAGLFCIKGLSFLELDSNQLTSLPESIGSLQKLELLNVSSNRLEALPTTIAQLTNLKLLNAECNRLEGIPEALGHCSQLVDCLLAGNVICKIPHSFSMLQNLRCLSLNKNRITTVPSSLFRCCTRLSTLGLHDNPVTVEQLRDIDGYKEFDNRRKEKYDKIIDMDVMLQRFDEGADAVDWRR